MQKSELISKIESGDFTLSFSAIKAFAKSPSHFIAYKTGERKETAAMKKGTLIHCAILEPEQLEKRYCILERDLLPFPDKDFRNTENNNFKKEFEAKAIEQGKEIIDFNEWDNAIQHRDLAYNNEVIAPYLTKLKTTEYGVNWEYYGYNWRGVIDGIGSNYILDLKTVADASPDKAIWLAKQEKYHWQQFLYKQSERIAPYFSNYNLLVDADMGISLHKIEWTALERAKKELEIVLDQFKICTEHNLWHQNYEFWAGKNSGIFIIE